MMNIIIAWTPSRSYQYHHCIIVLFALSYICHGHALSVQPLVTELETNQRNAGSMMISNGTPWCQDQAPAFWFPGHSQPDKPMCKLGDNKWAGSTITELDRQDKLNIKDGPTNIDRHGCTAGTRGTFT